MITGVICYKSGTLVVEFPCKAYDLAEHLSSIGIGISASEIPIQGNELVEVKLIADEQMGEVILSKLTADDTLAGLNIVCQEIEKACPYGYENFIDMLIPKPEGQLNRYQFYKTFETLEPSAATGTKFLLEEVRRYSSTMENYSAICEAEALEDSRLAREVNRILDSGEDEWER